jgi:hypothetical protein
MSRFTSFLLITGLIGIAGAGALATPQQRGGAAPAKAAGGSVLPRVVAAANAWLATLDEAQRAKALFPFDTPQKKNWSNLPSGIFVRNSLSLANMTPPQRTAAMALMSTVLSRDGYEKAVNIMESDEALKNGSGARQAAPGGAAAPAKGGGGGRGGRGGGTIFGKDEYYLALLGTPSTTTPWQIQFGGHHLGINVTIVGPKSVITPSLPATQPATFTLNGQTIRPLADETDKGFALINALNATQRAKAILPYRVTNLVLGPLEDGKTIQPEGLLASELTPPQQTMLLDIVNEWVGMLNDEAAAERMAEIRANLARTYFAWSGSTTPGEVNYYRIQGPTLVIEYSPQGNTEHIHTIYRDPTNDYGSSLVAPR